MSDYIRTPLDTDSPEFQGSVLRGILGSIVGMRSEERRVGKEC